MFLDLNDRLPPEPWRRPQPRPRFSRRDERRLIALLAIGAAVIVTVPAGGVFICSALAAARHG